MPPPEGITEAQVGSVRTALESPKWDWRTVGGVATGTGLPEATVRRILRYLIEEGDVIRSEIDSDEGEELYTTRSHYEKKATIWDRVRAALR
jgi:DNA-binding IclR family transcriptional regulator